MEGIIMQKFIKSFLFVVVTLFTVSNTIWSMSKLKDWGNRTSIRRFLSLFKLSNNPGSFDVHLDTVPFDGPLLVVPPVDRDIFFTSLIEREREIVTRIQQNLPFLRAVMQGDAETMKQIVCATIGVNENAEADAFLKNIEPEIQEIANNPAQFFDGLLKNMGENAGFYLNQPGDPDHPEDSRLLDWASEAHNASCVKVFLEHGADPTLVTKEHQKIIQAILSH